MLENTAHESLGFILLVLSFCVFALSLPAWGWLFTRSASFTISFLAGSAFALVVPPILSVFGILNHAWIPVAFALLPLPALLKFRKHNWLPKVSNYPEKIMLIALGLLFVCRFFEASLLQPHGDPLYYNLLSAAKWRQAGRIEFIPDLPLLFQSSWWDYIYLWPAMFFQTAPNQGLVESQIFSQWLHFFIGFGGSLLIWNKILSQMKFHSFAKLISTFAIAAISSMWWTASLAKNDWGAIFLFFGGLTLFFDSQFFFAGIILGMSFAAKWTILPILAIFLIWFSLKKPKEILKIIGGLALGVLPIVLRNIIATTDPIFPIPMGNFGKAFLSETFLEYLQKFSPGLAERNWGAIFTVRSSIIFESPFIILGLGALCILIYNKMINFASKVYLLAIGGFGFFILISGPWAENRLYGPGLALLAGSGALLLTEFKKPFMTWSLVILTLATSKIPTFMPKKFFEEFPPSPSFMNSGDLKEQIRKMLPPGTRIATSGDNELYYLSYYEISDANNNPLINGIVRQSTTVQLALKEIRAKGYRYFLHNTRYDGQCWEGLCQKLQAQAEQYENAVVLRGNNGVLLDLDRLP